MLMIVSSGACLRNVVLYEAKGISGVRVISLDCVIVGC